MRHTTTMKTLPIALALLSLPVATAHAQTVLVVPGTYATIQGAISAAVNGDSVLILPGTYMENIDVQGKDITIGSLGGAQATVIDGGLAGPTVVFSPGSTRAAVLEGLTITGGYNTGGSPVSIGGGIRVESSAPTIRDCIIRENTSDSYGAGIGVTGNPAEPLIERCTIESNHATGLGYASGGGIAISAATPGGLGTEVRRCTIADNDAATRGGGIYMGYAPGCIVDACRITRNATVSTSGNFNGGAGIFISLGSVSQVSNCRIWNNLSGSDGGGVKWFNVTGATFTNNTIVGNAGGGAAGFATAAAFGTNVVCDFTNTILWQNGVAEFVFTGADSAGVPPSANVNHSVVTGGYMGTANLNLPPQLLNADSGNHRLAATSPCVNAGSAAFSPLSATDMDGNARTIGANPDIGAHEFVPSAPQLYSNVSTLSASAPAPINYTVTNGRPGDFFAVLFGLSGTEPGTMVLGRTAPLNADGFTSTITLIGGLDPAGNGTTTFPTPATIPAAVIGITLSSAAITFGSAIAITNDENVRIIP